MDSSSPNRLERILRLLSHLQSGPSYNAQQLAAELQVHRRTVFRDLSLLRNAGVAVRFDENSAGYCVPAQHTREPIREHATLPCDEDLDLELLLAAVRLSPLEAAGQLGRSAHQCLLRLLATLPDETQVEMDRLLKSFVAEGPSEDLPPSGADALRVIFQGVRKCRQVKLVVEDPDSAETAETHLAPYKICFGDGVWRVIGHSSLDNAIRSFALDSIAFAELTDEAYSIPRGFSGA